MSNHYTVEPLKTAASVLEDKPASIQRWADAMLADRLHEEPAAIAYLELGNYGPANDYDGKRSAANRLSREIEQEVLAPAQILLHSLRHGGQQS